MPWITQGKCFWLKSKDDIVQHALHNKVLEPRGDQGRSYLLGRLHRGPRQLHHQVLRKILESLLSVGIMVSILTTLFVCDYHNKVCAVAFGFRRFLNILSLFFADHGGYFRCALLL